MTTNHEDLPHPVPPFAYLRYKENWFFIILDKANDVFGVVHINAEPIFEHMRFAMHLTVKGQLYKHATEVPLPTDYALSQEISDGSLTVRFIKPREHIELSLTNEDMDIEVNFIGRAPLFDYADYDFANPEKLHLSEIMNLGTKQQFVHQQQGMSIKGKLKIKTGALSGIPLNIDAVGYRDHSRSVRSDNWVLKHFWNGLIFKDHVFGAISVTGILRPESQVSCGYVYDDQKGLRSLKQVDISGHGDGPDGLPATVEFNLTDIYDQPFTIVSDLRNRYSHVPLHAEKPGAIPYIYDIVENFAPVTLKQTSENGIGLVEIGWSTPK